MIVCVGSAELIDLRLRLIVVLIFLIVPNFYVEAHTPNVMMSILKADGPAPLDILETAGFVEGDGVKFKVGDETNNSTLRVSIDLDRDGVFNESVDYFSPWMVYECQYDENGTLLQGDCVVSDVFYFNGTNGSGVYSYQVEKMVNDSHTDFWVNTIFVGLDDHTEPGIPNVGDCFGTGCEDDYSVAGESDDSNKNYIVILMVISAIGLIGMAISILKESPVDETKIYLNERGDSSTNVVNNVTKNIIIQDSVVIGDVGSVSTEEE